MAVKPIIDLQLDDTRAKATLVAFERYFKGLKEAAPRLKMAERATHSLALATAEVADALKDQEKAHERLLRYQAKRLQEAERADKKRRDDAHKALKDMRNTAGGLAQFIGKATGDILKWTGVAGVIGSVLGLAGLDKLAGGVTTNRIAALGIGIKPSQLKAFNLAFGTYGFGGNDLSNAADVQQDKSRLWAYGAMGIRNADRKDPAELYLEAMTRARSLWQNGPKTSQYAESKGLLAAGFNLNQLRELAGLSNGEFNARKGDYRNNELAQRSLNEASRPWQEFLIRLKTSGAAIETVIVRGLTPLITPLGHLATAISNMVMHFETGGTLERWTQQIGQAIESFAKYLGSKSFMQDVKNFAQGVKDMAAKIASPEFQKGIADFGDKLFKIVNSVYEFLVKVGMIKPAGQADAPPEHLQARPFSSMTRAFHESVKGKFSVGGKDLLDRILWKESRGNNPKFNGLSPKGAYGAFQLMPDTAADYGVTDRGNFQQSQSAAGRYLGDLIKMFHGDLRKAVAAYNRGPGNLRKDIRKDLRKHGKDWEQFLPEETKDYLKEVLPIMLPVKVTLNTPPGSEISNNSNQAAAQK